MDKIIGTHNTMSYLPPKHWWQKPFNWLFAQCQNKYPDNDTCVDFRIYYNEDTKDWEFAHGLISYDSIFGAFLNICGSITSVSCKYVRLILERDGHEDDFINLCKRYEKNYPLLEEERQLLFILMSMPERVEFTTNEYECCKKVTRMIDYIYKAESIVSPYYTKKEETK